MNKPNAMTLHAMRNVAMRTKLERGEALDVSQCPNSDGRYEIDDIDYREGIDYCDAQTESWIWSIGRRRSDNKIIASVSPDLYDNPDFECLWLR
jgi:hypothetical protein